MLYWELIPEPCTSEYTRLRMPDNRPLTSERFEKTLAETVPSVALVTLVESSNICLSVLYAEISELIFVLLSEALAVTFTRNAPVAEGVTLVLPYPYWERSIAVVELVYTAEAAPPSTATVNFVPEPLETDAASASSPRIWATPVPPFPSVTLIG